ncbi:MAG TPA: phasin family protein [Thermoanaerobaculia bacterium]|nr:phasin family protein [Thermoanaerobaculia bacterium]
MKTVRKTAPVKLPFDVPVPVQQALRNAGTELDRLGARARSAAAKAEKTVRVAARDLAKTGETIRKDPRAFVEDVVESGKGLGEKLGSDVKARVQKAGKAAARRAEDVSKLVGDRVGTVVEKGLHRLNVPTRHELRNLAAKVDTLGRKIDTLKSRKPAVKARRAR